MVSKMFGLTDDMVGLTPAERLRLKMWQARASHSRTTGIALFAISGVFLAFSFLTHFLVLELVALASFVMGVFLIAVELEPRVKLLPSALGLMGPLLALSDDLERQGFTDAAAYLPREDDVIMQVQRPDAPFEASTLVPIGKGFADIMEQEIGPLKNAEISYLRAWVPKYLEMGLGVADDVKMRVESTKVEAAFRRPYVRSLCANEDFNARVCDRIGCPLVSSVGVVVASATRKKVIYFGCQYDRLTETSKASYEIKEVA